MTKIAINGFGRIGRLFFRQAFGHKGIDIVAVNDLGNLEDLAYLLRYDTVYRKYNKEVRVDKNLLIVDGKKIKVTQIKDPTLLPWKDLKIDIVVEATGAFSSYEKARAHINAGAKRVVITAPSKDSDVADSKTILVGVNENDFKSVVLSSNASCTTNSVSPVVAVLSENPGIEKAILNTVHAYTTSQSLLDEQVSGDDLRRGRAAAHNMIPSTTGAAKTLSKVIKELEGKFDGIAIRVPIITGSIADITFISKRKTSAEEINDILRKASKSSRWKNIMMVTEDPIVSSDIVGQPYGAIVDPAFTKVVDGNLVKVLSWYDNEFGYASTLLMHVLSIAKFL
jgi:glyceraldehyde 3-phosphate dehydrogenase